MIENLPPHPWFYAGINDWGLATDEIDSAGVNDRIWVNTFDASRVPTPMVVGYPYTPEADFTVADERKVFTVKVDRQKAGVGET